jgi:septum formation protein
MIYLASNSPRRRELLDQIGASYQQLLLRSNPARGVDVDETPLDDEPAIVYVQRVAQQKAYVAWERCKQRNMPLLPILTADTTVSFKNNILGKPTDFNDALRMLQLLSGQTHQVLTAVTVMFEDKMECVLSTTDVKFCNLTEDAITRYFSQEPSLDKAGAYGLQGKAAAFIEHISGSDSGVKGLPLYETYQLLKKFNAIT